MPAMTKAELVAENEALRKSLSREVAKRKREEQRSTAKIQQLTAGLTEALEQQTATAEILRVICTSPTDLQPVLDTVVASAARFCGAYDVTLLQVDGDRLRFPAHYGPIPVPADPRSSSCGVTSRGAPCSIGGWFTGDAQGGD